MNSHGMCSGYTATNTSELSNKPSPVPVEIRKLAKSSSQFHIFYISGNISAGCSVSWGKVDLMEGLLPPSSSSARQGSLVCYQRFHSVEQGGENIGPG